MADIINFASYAALQEIIAGLGTKVSGMTAAEAAAALGGSTTSAGIYTAAATTAESATVVPISSAASAAEAFANYTAAGGTTAAGSGAAASLSGVSKFLANIGLIQGTGTGTGIAGVLTAPVTTAAAMLAPVAGIALGAGLYSSNPELWTKISETLLPFCYGNDYPSMPIIIDQYGNTYIDQDAIDAMKALVEDEKIGEPGRTSPLSTNWSQPIRLIPANTLLVWHYITYQGQQVQLHYFLKVPVLAWMEGTLLHVKGVSTSPDADAHIYTYLNESGKETQGGALPWDYVTTYNDIPVYTTYRIFSIGDQYGMSIDPSETTAPDDNTIWTSINGTVSEGYPEGTSAWEGDPYPQTVTPLQVLTEIDPDEDPVYTPYYPVALPIGDPGVTTNPEINPDPTTNPDPEPVVTPYISPVTSPELVPQEVPTPAPAPTPATPVVPQPATENVPSPDVDPSIDQDPTPEEGNPYPDTPTNPQQPEQPTDEGTTPTPVLPVSPIPAVGALGLLHVYNPTQSQVDAFGAWLWETWSDTSIWETIQKLFNDPMDGVIGLHELYATPNISGSGTIRCGYLDSEIASSLVGSRYTTINCGTVIVEEYYQNYLDYSPYTQCYIYLPFIGIVSVSSDDIVGNAVQITYRIDAYTGACIAIVTCAKDGYSANVYQFEGNCAVEVPITSGYQSTMMSGLLALAGTAVTGNPLSGLAAGHMGRSGLGKNEVQHSGSFGASYGAMGAKVPYLIVKRPVQKKVTNYSQSYGYPAHKMVYIGNCRNFLRVKEVRVLSTTATNEEKDLIVQKLKEGVYVR